MSSDDCEVTGSGDTVCFFYQKEILQYCKTVVSEIDVINFLLWLE